MSYSTAAVIIYRQEVVTLKQINTKRFASNKRKTERQNPNKNKVIKASMNV